MSSSSDFIIYMIDWWYLIGPGTKETVDWIKDNRPRVHIDLILGTSDPEYISIVANDFFNDVLTKNDLEHLK